MIININSCYKKNITILIYCIKVTFNNLKPLINNISFFFKINY